RGDWRVGREPRFESGERSPRSVSEALVATAALPPVWSAARRHEQRGSAALRVVKRRRSAGSYGLARVEDDAGPAADERHEAHPPSRVDYGQAARA
ncbi:MAG: hypothetical protein LC667_09705, partial [Thioalkalivibrio sp.]|nr:hypothetical protein [Thioalkalivibrio sp.]